MYTLSSNITITDPSGAYYLDSLPVIECKIKKSRLTLTDTASITLPRNLKIFKNNQSVDINTVIQRNAAVSIQLGYDGNLVTRFTGFVSKVNAQVPVTIECQDQMYQLKQTGFTKTWGKVKVAEIVSDIYTGAAQVVDLEIGGLTAKNQSTAQILDSLKKFGLQCYFNKGTLIVDFPGAVFSSCTPLVYDFYQNILENKLEYKLKEDFNIVVKGTSTLDTGKVIKIPKADDNSDEENGAEVIKLDFYNMDENHLQTIVTEETNAVKYDGYRGSFTTFGLPVIEPGDIAELHDPLYPEHDGSYLTESVEITFGVDGYRQEPELERKLS